MAVSTATAWTRRARPLGVIGLAARRSLCRTADSSSKAAGCSGRAASSSLALETDSNQSWGNNLRGLGHNNYLGKILNARVYEAAHETPLQPAKALSSRTGCQVLLKREDLQPVRHASSARRSMRAPSIHTRREELARQATPLSACRTCHLLMHRSGLLTASHRSIHSRSVARTT